MTKIISINPYKIQGVWAFDDNERGLSKEPFVDEVNFFIDAITSKIDHADEGFRLLFSEKPFPGFMLSFKRTKNEYDGVWYSCEQLNGEGWLCPALFKYFTHAPEQLFVKAEV